MTTRRAVGAGAAVALGMGVGLAGYPLVAFGTSARVALLGIAALALLGLALAFPRAPLAGLAAGTFGAQYGVALLSTGADLDLGAPAYAVLWFLLIEMADWVREARTGWRPEPRVVLTEMASALGLGALGGVVAAAALAIRAASPEFGVAATLVAAGCILGAVVVPVMLAHRAVWEGSATGPDEGAEDAPREEAEDGGLPTRLGRSSGTS